MTIRAGKDYVVETTSQFVERGPFDWTDLGVAIHNSDLHDFEFDIENYNEEIIPDIPDAGPIESVEELPTDAIVERLTASNVSEEAMIAAMQADDRDWVHLFDGTCHRIIKLHPPSE